MWRTGKKEAEIKRTSSQIFGGTLNFSLPFAVNPRRPRRNPVGKGERGKKIHNQETGERGKSFHDREKRALPQSCRKGMPLTWMVRKGTLFKCLVF